MRDIYTLQGMLIGICGKKGSGKSTLASYIMSQYAYEEKAFADPIKRAAVLLFQLQPAQLEGDAKEMVDERYGLSPRQMFQLIGTDMFREMVDKEFWVDYFRRWYVQNNKKDVVVPDVRFQNEVNAIHELGGVIVRIHRSDVLHDNHVSESGVDLLQGIDIEISNDVIGVTNLWATFEQEKVFNGLSL